MALSYGAAYDAIPTLPSAPVIIVSGRDPRRVGFPSDLHTLPEYGKFLTAAYGRVIPTPGAVYSALVYL